MRASDGICSKHDYEDVIKKLLQEHTLGLPRYILQHIDAAIQCNPEGIIQPLGMDITVGKGGSVSTTRYAFNGLESGFDEEVTDFFAHFSQQLFVFQKSLVEVEVVSPPSGASCHGCVSFRATYKTVHGPRLPAQDLDCDKEVPRDRVGYCECGEHYFPESSLNLDIHMAHITCSEVCTHANYTGLKPRPVTVSLRIRTGITEGGESVQSPRVSFGSDPTQYTMDHLPARNDTVVYDLHLPDSVLTDDGEVPFDVKFYAENSTDHDGKDAYYFGQFDMAVGPPLALGRFHTLGPVHAWLVADPKSLPHNEFGGDTFGNLLELKPFHTIVNITAHTGAVPNAVPQAGMEPSFWVQGAKDLGRWYYGGQLDLSGGANATSVTTVEIRKDIGDVVRLKLAPVNKTGGEWFYTEIHTFTTSNHPAHTHETKKMHPGHLWLAPSPTQTDDFYSFNQKVGAEGIELTPERPLPTWDGSTCGGTAPRGTKCKFPFTYMGQEYNECTVAGKSKYERWCETEAEGTWAYCDCNRYTTWQGTAGPGQQCKFPFKKNGKWHDDCIPSSQFESDLSYACDAGPGGRCTGGMPNGVCSVDSLFQGRWAACQPRGIRPAIAQTQRYTNGQGTVKGGVACAFPFFYRETWIQDCIGDAYGGFGWCSVDTIYGKKWGGCRKALPSPKRYIRWPDDITNEVGANSSPDDKCVFPFHHHGGTHYDCIGRGGDTPHGWCSLDKFFKGRWGACAHSGYKPHASPPGARWTNGKGTVEKYTACKFPFTYRGKKYHGCMGRNDDRPTGWCSTTENWANKWGECLAPGTEPPKQDCVLTEWSEWNRGDPDQGLCSPVANADEDENDHNTQCEGKTHRVRSVFQKEKFGGKPCSVLPELRKQTRMCKAAAGCQKAVDGSVTNALTGVPISNAKVTVKCHANPPPPPPPTPVTTPVASGSAESGPPPAPPASGSAATPTASDIALDNGACATTTGGNANGAGCKFPFDYFGTVYHTCDTEHHPKPWCYTDGAGRWGECTSECISAAGTDSPQESTTPHATPAPPALVLPDGDPCGTTTEGTAEGAGCSFPFSYADQSYNTCTMTGHDVEWCYTDAHGSWGECSAACLASRVAGASGSAAGSGSAAEVLVESKLAMMLRSINHKEKKVEAQVAAVATPVTSQLVASAVKVTTASQPHTTPASQPPPAHKSAPLTKAASKAAADLQIAAEVAVEVNHVAAPKTVQGAHSSPGDRLQAANQAALHEIQAQDHVDAKKDKEVKEKLQVKLKAKEMSKKKQAKNPADPEKGFWNAIAKAMPAVLHI